MNDPGGPAASASPTHRLESLRGEIDILDRFVPLNHCSQAPPTRATLAATDRFVTSWREKGMAWDEWLAEVEAARAAFAGLVGADAQDVAVFSSVSHAAAAVASAIDFPPSRRDIVLTDAEFPTVAHVWGWQARRGAHLDWVEVGQGAVDPAAVVDRITRRSRLVSITHGHYETGALLPIEAAVARARDVGAYAFVDAYQTLGTRPLDVGTLGADFLVAGALKYLMGVAGIAFLWVRPELASTLEPATTGWFGRTDPFAFDPRRLDWAPGARRFDSGTPPLLPAYIARAGMGLLARAGVETVSERITALCARAIERAERGGLELLGPSDPSARTANLAFDCGTREGSAVEGRMRDEGFLVSARGRAIRLAPHGYNVDADLDAAVDVLIDILGPS